MSAPNTMPERMAINPTRKVEDDLYWLAADESKIGGYKGTIYVRADLAPQPGQAVDVPDGWKLVPIDPTLEMESAGQQAIFEDASVSLRVRDEATQFSLNCWTAMLDSAPPARDGSSEAVALEEIETAINDMIDTPVIMKRIRALYTHPAPSPAPGDGHDSDCSTHNMPTYLNGPCDCGQDKPSVPQVTWDDVRVLARAVVSLSATRHHKDGCVCTVCSENAETLIIATRILGEQP